MKAVLHTQYGPPDVLTIGTLPLPQPGPGQLRIKIHASSVTSGDARIRRADPFLVRLFFGLLKPKYRVPGFEFAGTVDALGEGVTRYQLQDRVFGVAGFTFGALAEYLIVKAEGTLAPLPEDWSFEQAAAIPFGATTAKYFLETKGNIQPTDRVLIHGASGAVGVAAVQLASHNGAAVDALCGTAHVNAVRALGAREVIDYHTASPAPNAYDLVFDAAGKTTSKEARAWLKPGGRFVSVQKGYAKDTPADYPVLAEWMSTGVLQPVIDQVYPLEDIVEAHRHVDHGHKLGSVIIRIAQERSSGTPA